MPPKRAGPASDTPSLPTAFFPGGNGLIIPPFVHPPKKPVKKKVIPSSAPPPPPPKKSFFIPGAAVSQSAAQSFVRKPPFIPRRSFLYDQFTDEPYAEWIGNEAVCLDTGEVLFESKRGSGFDNEQLGERAAAQFDFSPPTQKHPKDPSIVSQDLIDAGILTTEDFKNGSAGLSLEMVTRYKDGLSSE